MQGGRRLTASLTFLAASAALAAGCGAKKDDTGRPIGAAQASGGTAATGGATASGGSGGTAVVSVAGMSGSAGSGASTSECGGDQYDAMLAPLDLYVMLDSSASMLEVTNGSTKWAGIQSALTTFVADPASSGIGIGLQFFPQQDPKVPLTCKLIADCGSPDNLCIRNFCVGAAGFNVCDTNADCKAGNTNYGPCTRLTYCWSSGGATPCHDDSECGNVRGDCVEIGRCSGDSTYVCPQIGQPCVTSDGKTVGNCVTDENTTCERTSNCDPGAYGAPAAEIATLPGAATALSSVILGHMPDGRTPTAPALEGALTHAVAWAKSHAGHSVAVVLATDGLPTECIANVMQDPTGVDEVVGDAKAALGPKNGDPSISTFVIGIFSADDLKQMAGTNLNRIAAAGGTTSAHVIDVSGNVEQDFLAALDAIRGTQLPCDFQIPTPTNGTTFDKGKVNVVYSHDGQTDKLYYWPDAGSCDPTAGGWYYDADPPTQIIACPASCSAFQAANGDPMNQAKVSIQLGCDSFKEPR